MKKLLAMVASMAMVCCSFAGCGDSSSSSKADTENSSAAESVSDSSTEGTSIADELLAKYPVNAGAYDVSQGASENMIARSVINEGDTTRLAEKISHAKDNPKETTKICFIGDSITAGSGANSTTMQFVNQYKTWWEENVSYYVDVNNAGIGATDSYIGVHRAQRDALEENPEIIVIEFINDADDEFYESCMDSLVRMCLEQENNPAVIILEPTVESGYSPQASHLKVAQAYNIPMLSYHDAVYPEVAAGNFAFSDISPDGTHPNDAGHTIMASILTKFCEAHSTNEGASTAFDTTIESPTGDVFANASIGTRETSDTVKTVDEGTFTDDTVFQSFTKGWGTKTGGTIKFEITAKNIGMIYLKTIDGKSGMVSIKVDGNEVSTLDGNFSNGWGDYAKADSVYSSDTVATHEVEVTVADGAAQNFQILDWLIS